jgi:hypothetical protein
MFLGFFWHYPQHLPQFDADYKVSRLPWVLPGVVAHWVEGPVVAALLLVWLTVTVGAVAVYLIVRDLTRHRTAAAITGVAWACFTGAHGIGGWNYQMLAACDYYLLASWLAIRTGRDGRPRDAVLAGSCLAAAVHTHLSLLVFVPVYVLTYWNAFRRQGPFVRSAVADGLFALAGACALTLGLSFIHRFSGGPWLFFMPQVEYTMYLSRAGNQAWTPIGSWLPTAVYLIVPMMCLLSGAAVIGSERFRNRAGAVPMLLGWLAFGLLCYLEFGRHQTILDSGYQAFALNLYAFPCAGVAMARRDGAAQRGPLMAISAAALILLPLLLLLPTPLPGFLNHWAGRLAGNGYWQILPPLVVGLVGVVVFISLPRRFSIPAFALTYSLINAWLANPSAYGVRTPGYLREMHQSFGDADRFTTALDPGVTNIRYWFGDETISSRFGPIRLAPVFDSFVSSKGSWLGNLLAATSPGLPIAQLTPEHLSEGVCVGVLTSVGSADAVTRDFQEHFADLRRPLRIVGIGRYEHQNLSFVLTVLKPLDQVELTRAPCSK